MAKMPKNRQIKEAAVEGRKTYRFVGNLIIVSELTLIGKFFDFL
jgi:hypothetical protein